MHAADRARRRALQAWLKEAARHGYRARKQCIQPGDRAALKRLLSVLREAGISTRSAKRASPAISSARDRSAAYGKRCRADYTPLAVNPGENKLIEISYLQATRIYAKVDIQRLPHIEPAVAGRRRPGYGELCGDRVVSRLSCRSNWSISDRVAPGPSSGIATYRGQRARP